MVVGRLTLSWLAPGRSIASILNHEQYRPDIHRSFLIDDLRERNLSPLALHESGWLLRGIWLVFRRSNGMAAVEGSRFDRGQFHHANFARLFFDPGKTIRHFFSLGLDQV